MALNTYTDTCAHKSALPGPGTKLTQVNEPWAALHNQGRSLRWQRGAGAGVRSLKCLCLRAETTVLGCKTNYIMPRSVVAVVSQEGHGDARSFDLLS